MREIRDAVVQLASEDAAERRLAASWLYIEGCMLAESATRALYEDPDFAALLSKQTTVGIAVHPITFENIRRANGSPRLAEVPPDLDAQEFELHLGEARLDILTTRALGASGAIAKFLEKYGDGIQQVEYFVKDVDRAAEILREKFGVRTIYPQTRDGADGTRVNFFLASTPENRKVLIELVETS